MSRINSTEQTRLLIGGGGGSAQIVVASKLPGDFGACPNHKNTAASFECDVCHQNFCPSCIRQTSRSLQNICVKCVDHQKRRTCIIVGVGMVVILIVLLVLWQAHVIV